MKKIKLRELKGTEFSVGVEGIGSCGFAWDEGRFTGYLYASEGYGNTESYWSVSELLARYPQLASLPVEVVIVDGKIASLRG